MKSYVEVVHQKVIRKAEQMMKHSNCTIAAAHGLHRNETHTYQLMQWASMPFAEDCFHDFKEIVWEAFPYLAHRLDPSSLESKGTVRCTLSITVLLQSFTRPV